MTDRLTPCLHGGAVRAVAFVVATTLLAPAVGAAQSARSSDLPLRQSSLDSGAAKTPLTLRDVSNSDRWIGVGVREVRWSPDGSALYFRWPPNPKTGEDPATDPWFSVDREGRQVTPVPDSLVAFIPDQEVSWSRDGRLAAWAANGKLYLYDPARRGSKAVRAVAQGAAPPRNVRV
ncbi:MAG TPA: hypothetical protein VMM77_11965, partial [Gemmatimonadaceae bacterium]|nr:hypothetical protein [Gemmatimonadaceae bacterium]